MGTYKGAACLGTLRYLRVFSRMSLNANTMSRSLSAATAQMLRAMTSAVLVATRILFIAFRSIPLSFVLSARSFQVYAEVLGLHSAKRTKTVN